jgi:beta-aspartyl-peptidase (threonine type)
VAYDIVARVKYAGENCETAAEEIVNKKLKNLGADGGVIVLAKDGKIAMPFNTTGMFRGYLYPNQNPEVFIFDKEKN